MSAVEEVDAELWTGPFAPDLQRGVTSALEAGKVLYFPRLGLDLTQDEKRLLALAITEGNRKNITFDPAAATCHGGALAEDECRLVESLLRRFADATADLVAALMPRYADGIARARTTYRPVEIKGREYSPRKDDRRLHIDAFPSRPTQGRRILRVFTNINPGGESRLWRVGEKFEDFASRYISELRPPNRFESWLLAKFGITKERRCAYDQMMLQLHDKAKLDADYQANAPNHNLAFPPGTTWICYTDQVLHAALAGRFALEQTFHLSPDLMLEPARSPLRVLERMSGRALA
jgi:hypothetical protein